MSRLNGFFKILRPVNSIMMGLGIFVGVVLSSSLSFNISSIFMFYAFLTGFTLTGSAMVINDYFDREIDAVNEPNRPIPSGEVKPREAIIYSISLSLIGLASAYITGALTFGIALFSCIIMIVYSAWGKKTGFMGNLMVSTCIALPFIYGGILTSNPQFVLIFSLLAFITNTGREITKGIVDIEGDRGRGVKTVAVSFGVDKAVLLSVAFYLGAVAVSIIPIYLRLVTLWYIPLLVATDLGLFYSSLSLIKDRSRDNGRRVKNQILYWMALGLSAFVAGRL